MSEMPYGAREYGNTTTDMNNSNWNVVSDNPRNNYTNIRPIAITRGTPPIRSRNESSNYQDNLNDRSRSHNSSFDRINNTHNSRSPRHLNKSLNDKVVKSLSRISIANVLKGDDENINVSKDESFISTNALLTQKLQMKKNNADLHKFMSNRAELTKQIRELENENKDLRIKRNQHITPSPDYKPPVKNKKQRQIDDLHEDIYNSEKHYDTKFEELNALNYKTNLLADDIKYKVDKAEKLQGEKEKQYLKAQASSIKIPPKERERDYLRKEIADNEENFENAYTRLLKELATKKQVEMPPISDKPEYNSRHLDNLKDQMKKIRNDIQQISDNVERKHELDHLRVKKDELEKANNSMTKQTDLLENKINLMSNEFLENKRAAAAKKAQLDSLNEAFSEEKQEHDEKIRNLNLIYKDLFDTYNNLVKDINEQKERTTHHKSIKDELSEMRRLLNMQRMSIAGGNTGNFRS